MSSEHLALHGAPGLLELPAPARERLRGHLRAAVRDARRHGSGVAAASWRLPAGADPSAIVLASRRAGEAWMCFEQPERSRSAIAALGAAVSIEERGPERFARAAARWRELVERAHMDAVAGPPGSGLIACGGFAFAADGGASPHWSRFAPASLVLGEVTLARWGEETWCTVSSAASRRSRSARCRFWTRIRPSARRSPARWPPSTTRRRSAAPSS